MVEYEGSNHGNPIRMKFTTTEFLTRASERPASQRKAAQQANRETDEQANEAQDQHREALGCGRECQVLQ